MDLSKAFDSLNHNINKLTYCGVKNSANALLRSFLSKVLNVSNMCKSMI